MFIFDRIGRALAVYLTAERDIGVASPATSTEKLLACLRPADILLVEGSARISSAIKYLSQSTWSHSALYVGKQDGDEDASAGEFVEVDLIEGVRRVGVETYAGLHTRICRPVGLDDADRAAVTRFVLDRLGERYDLRNFFDLVRYLLPNPPVPTRWRRRMIALGGGDPTRAICSTLIAQAFHSIRYPILPEIETPPGGQGQKTSRNEEILAIRHHSLFTPRDFDASPYFQIVKPTLENGFDYKALKWKTEPRDDC